METTPSLFVRLHGLVRGPVAPAQLRNWAESGVITPATEVAAEAGGPWVQLETLPAAADLFPKRVQFGFKTPAFENANRDSAPPVDHRELIALANQQRRVGPPVPRAPEVKPATAWESDVHAMLRLNLAKEKAHGLNELAPMPPRRSRRNRDYLVLMTGLALVIFPILGVEAFVAAQVQTLAAGMPDQFGPLLKTLLFHSPILWWGLAGWCVLGIGFGWLMFGVMNDY